MLYRFYFNGEVWVSRDKANSIDRSAPPNMYRLSISGTIISIIGILSGTVPLIIDTEVTDIEKDNVGGRYDNIDEFITATLSFFDGSKKVEIRGSDRESIDQINPLSVSQGEISVNDIDWEASDFTGWIGDPKDLFGPVSDGGIYNDSPDSPKTFTLMLKRSKLIRVFGAGSDIGSHSNYKVSILGSGGISRGILDASDDSTKRKSTVYLESQFVMNAIVVEFFTEDRIDLTNLFFKEQYSNKKQDIIHKFGVNPDIDLDGNETVWTLGDNYIFTTIPQNYFISSSSNLDNQKIKVETVGINVDGRLQQEITEVTLNGQSSILIPTSFLCIASNRAFVDDVDDLAGSVYIYESGAISGGVPVDLSLVRSVIPSGINQTLQAVYTVPEFLANGRQVLQFDLYSYSIELTLKRAVAGVGSLFVKPLNKAKLVKSVAGFSEDSRAEYEFGETTPLTILPGSDIWLQVSEITTNNSKIAGKFKGSLITL